jgi:transcriptional regulator with XRE-family HTH domain
VTSGVAQKDLAAALGVSTPFVSKYKKRGMPVSNVESARAWIAANLGQSKAVPASAGPPIAEPPEDHPAEIVEVLNTVVPEQVAAINAQIEQIEEVMRWARSVMVKLNKEGNLEAARKWLHSWTLVSKKLQETREKLIETRIKSGELIRLIVAKEMVDAPLRRLRSALAKMPHELGGKCNPTNPEQATQAISEWCAAFYKNEQEYSITA